MHFNRLSLLRSLTLCLLIAVATMHVSEAAVAQEKPLVKSGLVPEDYAYKMAEGVTRREVTYYSDDVPCYAMLFFPKGYSTTARTPGIVLAQGWAGTHFSIEKYGARFAEKGMVAMVIDYRGWGYSDGFTTLAHKQKNDDANRFTRLKTDVVVKRTRLLPDKQVEDVRNAISYLQGEPGVDAEHIGLWGLSFGGGVAIAVAAQDARVRAIALQTPAIAGKKQPAGPVHLRGKMLDDAIRRARSGQGMEMETGFSVRRNIDAETNQMVAEFRPFRFVKQAGDRPTLFVVAAEEQLFDNADHAYAAMDLVSGPKKMVEVPDVTHFEMYINGAFEISSNAAADWFREYLGMNAAALSVRK